MHSMLLQRNSPACLTVAGFHRHASVWRTLCVGLLAGLCLPVAPGRAQTPPAWWTNSNIIVTNAVPNDYAPINQGQLKWLVTQTAVQFTSNGLDSREIKDMLVTFSSTNNYLPVNLGQMKNVAYPFYDVLMTNGLTNGAINCYPVGTGLPYPWVGSTNQPNNFALANIGQAKYLFSFDPSNIISGDADGSGLPNWWELKYFGHTGVDPNAILNGNGLTVLQAYRLGTDPNNPVTTPPTIQLCIPSGGATIWWIP